MTIKYYSKQLSVHLKILDYAFCILLLFSVCKADPLITDNQRNPLKHLSYFDFRLFLRVLTQ